MRLFNKRTKKEFIRREKTKGILNLEGRVQLGGFEEFYLGDRRATEGLKVGQKTNHSLTGVALDSFAVLAFVFAGSAHGSLPREIVSAGQELSELAGELKVAKKMSLADCFTAALAKREKAEIYTGDPEFKTVGREIKVVWL